MFDEIILAIKRLIANIKLKVKQYFCRHDKEIVRWHLIKEKSNRDNIVEAEYICTKCEHISYLYIQDVKRKREWIQVMGNYKREQGGFKRWD